MVRPSLAFVAGLLAVAAAAANGLPPPPVGKRFVPAEHVITAAKAFPDYEFYFGTTGTPKKVAFGPDTPVKIDSRRSFGKGGRIHFVAVPKGAAEKYADADAFAEALRAETVPGLAVARENFESPTVVEASYKGRTVTVQHVLERIDAKEGMVFRAAPGEKAAPNPDKAAPDAPGPRGGGVVAGLAVALAMAFAGVKLARRTRPA